MMPLRVLVAALAAMALVWLYVAPSGQALVATLADTDPATLAGSTRRRRRPLAVILLMALAIVFNPIPSAPIALVLGVLTFWPALWAAIRARR
jgi:uncharacterized membrane protein YdjX (TVP38/TMEM64 family)